MVCGRCSAGKAANLFMKAARAARRSMSESFVPLAQFMVLQPVAGIQALVWRDDEPYVPAKDPLQSVPERQSDAHLFYYHGDKIGTPLLMPDDGGKVV